MQYLEHTAGWRGALSVPAETIVETTGLPEMARRLRAHSCSGAMHIVVADGNLEDAHIQMCLEQPDVTEADRKLAADLLAMSEADREAAWTEAFEPWAAEIDDEAD